MARLEVTLIQLCFSLGLQEGPEGPQNATLHKCTKEGCGAVKSRPQEASGGSSRR